MISVPQEIQADYGALLVQQNMPLQHHTCYKKWLRYYWVFVIGITLTQRNLRAFQPLLIN